MITINNHDEKIVGLKLTGVLAESKKFYDESLKYYDKSAVVKETIDLYLNKLNEFVAGQNLPKKTPPKKTPAAKKLPVGVFIFDGKKYDLRKERFPERHPILVCEPNSPQFKDCVIEWFKAKEKKKVKVTPSPKKNTSSAKKVTPTAKTHTAATKAKPNKAVKDQIYHYTVEYGLVRRFFSFINKNIHFKQLRNLHVAIQKAIVSQKVRKSTSSNVFIQISSKVTKLMEMMEQKNEETVTFTLLDQSFQTEITNYVGKVEIMQTVKLLNRFISVQGLNPPIKRVENLLASMRKNMEKIPKTHHLFQALKEAIQTLDLYIKNKRDKVDPKEISLSGFVDRFALPTPVPMDYNPQLLNKQTPPPINSMEPPFELKETPPPVHYMQSSPSPSSSPLAKLGFNKSDEKVEVPGSFTLPGELGFFIQEIQPYKELILIKGTKHTSKSQLAMQIANGIAETGKDVAYIDYEQGGLQSKDTQNSLNWNCSEEGKKRIFIKGDFDKDRIFEDLHNICKHCAAVVADSVTDLGINANQLSDLRNKYPSTIWIFISQVKESGEMYGGNKMAHNPTKIIECFPANDPQERYALLEKNRGNQLNRKYHIFAKKCETLSF